jgi:hypothetical protein
MVSFLRVARFCSCCGDEYADSNADLELSQGNTGTVDPWLSLVGNSIVGTSVLRLAVLQPPAMRIYHALTIAVFCEPLLLVQKKWLGMDRPPMVWA